MKEAGNAWSEYVEQKILNREVATEMSARLYSPRTECSGLTAFM